MTDKPIKYINSSQVASMIGKNPYTDYEDTIYAILAKQYNIGDKPKTPYAKIKEYAALCNIDIKPIMKKIYGNSMLKSERDYIKFQLTNILRDPPKGILDAIDHLLNTRFGTINEDRIIRLYSEYIGRDIRCEKGILTKKICETDNCIWHMKGELDGIMDDGTIIEIKNRINRITSEIRPYEYVQVMCYLWLYGKDNAILIEALHHTDKQIKINTHKVSRSDDDITDIMDKLKLFIGDVETTAKKMLSDDII